MAVTIGNSGCDLRKVSNPHSMIPCSECSIGMMHQAKVTYFTWLGAELITVPDFPAWICDICGKREYDLDALNNLALLLSPMPRKLSGIKSARSLRKGGQEQPGVRPPAES